MEVVVQGLVADLEVVRPGGNGGNEVAVRVPEVDCGVLSDSPNQDRLADGTPRCRQEKHEREKAEGGDPHVGQYEGCFQVVFSGWEGTSDGAPNLGS